MSALVAPLPWTDYDSESFCDLYDPTGSYISYYIAVRYIHTYPSHWCWSVWQRSYDWVGTAVDALHQEGREFDRRSSKRESERWFKEHVGEIG
jgi:hypothetical protein